MLDSSPFSLSLSLSLLLFISLSFLSQPLAHSHAPSPSSHTRTHTHHNSTHSHTHSHTHPRTHKHTHTHTHTHAHTHAHKPSPPPKPRQHLTHKQRQRRREEGRDRDRESVEGTVLVVLVYHKSGLVLTERLLHGLARCMRVQLKVKKRGRRGEGGGEGRETLKVPPNLFSLENFEYWPSVEAARPHLSLSPHSLLRSLSLFPRSLLRSAANFFLSFFFSSPSPSPSLSPPSSLPPSSSSPSPSPPHVYYAHFVRSPLPLILSGYFYHQNTSEKWANHPNTTLCNRVKPLLSPTLLSVSSALSLSPLSLNRTLTEAKRECERLVGRYGSQRSYRHLLTAATQREGIWLEAYRSLSTIFLMIHNAINAPPLTFTHFTSSLRVNSSSSPSSPSFSLSPLVSSLLSFLQVPDRYLHRCHYHVMSAAKYSRPSHFTQSRERERERESIEKVLLRDAVLGDVIKRASVWMAELERESRVNVTTDG